MKRFTCVIASLVLALSVNINSFATELPSYLDDIEIPESVTVSTRDSADELISIDLPVIGSESPIDFHLDPQHMFANILQPGAVMEGASLLFRNNTEDGIFYSNRSDGLVVTNKSTVPLRVSLIATISIPDAVELVSDKSIVGERPCGIYMALVDDEGNEVSLQKDTAVSLTVELRKAPGGAYAYTYDEEKEKYVYSCLLDECFIEFDSYSFGLTGECSSLGNWSALEFAPVVNISWDVEPVYEDEDKDNSDEDEETDDTNCDEESDGSDGEEEVNVNDRDEAEGNIDGVDTLDNNGGDEAVDNTADDETVNSTGGSTTPNNTSGVETKDNSDKNAAADSIDGNKVSDNSVQDAQGHNPVDEINSDEAGVNGITDGAYNETCVDENDH
ncbi:MAG: hypothetical protein K6F84_01375 [Lachnospiraceae bacterium]|nr:hypothetical protein [Lachnospiraceae bacterium]